MHNLNLLPIRITVICLLENEGKWVTVVFPFSCYLLVVIETLWLVTGLGN